MEHFDVLLSQTIDFTSGLRCKAVRLSIDSPFAHARILLWRLLRGECQLPPHAHLSLHPNLRTCSADTILRALKELSRENTSYMSDSGKSYDFKTADTLHSLLVKTLVLTGVLADGGTYDLDFDHQFIETEKYGLPKRQWLNCSVLIERSSLNI